MARLILVGGFLLTAAWAIGAVFWRQELRYALPTPVPHNYRAVAVGSIVEHHALASGKAYFLHFYNPDCPCSRFNARHVKSMIRAHADSVAMYIVLPSHQDLPKAQREFAQQHFIVDEDGTLAQACGVYATPQAAIVDATGKLFYRGNYNRTRYCTAKATNFAELSLVALLNKQPSPSFGLLATQAYGCELTDPESDIELF